MISKRGVLGISQIFLLLMGIIAVAWAVGSEVGVVSGKKGSGDITQVYENLPEGATVHNNWAIVDGKVYGKTSNGKWRYFPDKNAQDFLKIWREDKAGPGTAQQPTSTLGLQERLFYFAEDVKDGEYGSFWSLTIGGGTALDAVASAASYAAAAYASIKLFTEIFGIEGEKARNIERAAVIGVGT